MTDGDYQKSGQIYHDALKEVQRLNDSTYIWISYINLANLYEETGNLDSSLHYNLLAYEMGLSVQRDVELKNLKTLARQYDEKGKRYEALLFKERYLHLSDSLMNLNELSRIKNTQLSYEMNKSSKRIEALNRETLEQEAKIAAQRKASLIVLIVLFTVFLCTNV